MAVPQIAFYLFQSFCLITLPDYCVVVFFIILVISIVQWLVDGRKNFKGPQVEIVGEGILDPSSRNGHADTGKLDGDRDEAQMIEEK